MIKSFAKGAGAILSFVSIGTMASAGSLAEGVAEPEVEDLVIEEAASSSIGWLPLVGLVIVGAIIASGDSDDDDKEETSEEIIED